MIHSRVLLAVAVLASCSQLTVVDAGPPRIEVPTPVLRLSNDVVPHSQSVTFVVDPKQKVFTGAATIEVTLARPASTIWLHGATLRVRRALINGSPAKTGSKGPFLSISSDGVVPAGAATLTFEWEGDVAQDDDDGLFHATSHEAEFVFSQFEATFARNAMPCFDEPNFKIPWKVTIDAPEGLLAVSNAPVESQSTAAGRQVTHFKETKPLPTYLVAIGVGPLTAIDLGEVGLNHTPTRIIVPTGEEGRAAYAGKSIVRSVEWLETWFGMPYPYEKLDFLVVTDMSSFGAMEHAGLVTIADTYALASEAELSEGFRRENLDTTAHELAHQWFGDLVTMAWWDDTWLNESFATWMASKAVGALENGWDMEAMSAETTHHTMGDDELLTARAIRQPIEDEDGIHNAFDGITYNKGAAIVSMFEAFIGPEAFQRGVRTYLQRHAHGNATASEFFADLSRGSGVDVTASFESFIRQPGVPVITVKESCREKRQFVTLAQHRQMALGSTAETTTTTWSIPVCLRAGDARVCVTLDVPSQEFDLGVRCAPVVLNVDGTGYFHVERTMEQVRRELAPSSSLTLLERLSVLADLQAARRAGHASRVELFELLPLIANAKSQQVVEAAAALASVDDDLIEPSVRAQYAALIRRHFGARARALGFVAKKNESAPQAKLREVLVPFVTERGEDPVLRADASRRLDAALAAPTKWNGEVDSLVFASMGASITDAQFALALEQVRLEQSPLRREALVGLLAGTWSVSQRARFDALFLDETIDIRDLQWGVLGSSRTRDARFAFVKANAPRLLARLPDNVVAWLPVMLKPCDTASRAEFEAFWSVEAPRHVGAELPYRQALEASALCIAERAASQPAVTAWLQRQPVR